MEKKFYWIKLKTDFFDSPAIDFLLSQEHGCDYIVLYQMLCLKTANTNGSLITQIGEMLIPYDTKKIVRDTKYFSFDTVTVALELYKKLGLIYECENNCLKISYHNEFVGHESGSKSAIKKREQRLRNKEKDIIEDTKGDKKGTNCLTENRDKRLEIRDKSIDIRERDKKHNALEQVLVGLADEELISAYRDFIQMRDMIKKPMTERALKISINKLFKLSQDKQEMIEILEQSINHNWIDIYPLKKETEKELAF